MKDIVVVQIKDLIVKVQGKYNYTSKEVVEFPNGEQGMVINAFKETANIAIIQNNTNNPVKVGDVIKPLGHEFKVSILDNIFGSILDITGYHLVGENLEYKTDVIEKRNVFPTAAPIYSRDFVNRYMPTGTTSIDAIIPIGRGQRELIIGDRQTGKSSIALNMIYAQKDSNIKTIYVAIGKKRAEIIATHNKFIKKGVADKTLIIAAEAGTTSISKYLAPYSATSIAEYYREKGEDILIIYDDLTIHADAYREVALLTGMSPGRDAYPGDIFYQHSRLLERAGKFSQVVGGGSITAIPIVETQAGDISGYIPTNVISITDGQIFTSQSLFNGGIRPAIDVTYSVSRIGSTAQTDAMKRVSGGLKLVLSEYNELKKVAMFSASMASENKNSMESGFVLEQLLKQKNEEVIEYANSVIILALWRTQYLKYYKGSTNDLEIIKEVISNFLTYDKLGKILKKEILKSHFNSELIDKYITQMILPIIKYHLISGNKVLKLNKEFMEIFGEVRDDGKVMFEQYNDPNAIKGVIYKNEII